MMENTEAGWPLLMYELANKLSLNSNVTVAFYCKQC
jgi:hypothetical protein